MAIAARSMPSQRRRCPGPIFSQATRVVAQPAKGSSTTSPGLLEAAMMRCIRARGFCVRPSGILGTAGGYGYARPPILGDFALPVPAGYRLIHIGSRFRAGLMGKTAGMRPAILVRNTHCVPIECPFTAFGIPVNGVMLAIELAHLGGTGAGVAPDDFVAESCPCQRWRPLPYGCRRWRCGRSAGRCCRWV